MVQFSGDSAYMGSDGQRNSDSSQQRSLRSSFSSSTALDPVHEKASKCDRSFATDRLSNDTARLRSSIESMFFICIIGQITTSFDEGPYNAISVGLRWHVLSEN